MQPCSEEGEGEGQGLPPTKPEAPQLDFDDDDDDLLGLVEEPLCQPLGGSSGRVEAEAEPTFLQPDLETSAREEDKACVVVATQEVTRAGEVISLLKHKHGLAVLTWRSEDASYVLGTHTAVIRMGEVEFTNGANKEKIVEKVVCALERYTALVLIVEAPVVAQGMGGPSVPGPGAGQRGRTKHLDLLVGHLAMAGVSVRYSASSLDTAAILASLVTREQSLGRALPRGLQPSVTQRELVTWLGHIPALGLGQALLAAASFPCPRDLVTASAGSLQARGKLSQWQAIHLAQFFAHKFRARMTDMAPL